MRSKFSYLWFSFLISSIGDWLYKLSIPIIILDKTGSSYHATTKFGVSFIPWIVFSLLGGSLSDNYDKKKILILGDIFSTIASFRIIMILSETTVNFTLMYIGVFILASIDPLTPSKFSKCNTRNCYARKVC